MEYGAVEKQKGVAGLSLIIEFVASLFVVGILIMSFVLAGTSIETNTTGTVAKTAINATYTAIDDYVTWFPIWITISAVVVMILLIVLIVQAVRGAGLMGGGA